MDADRKNYLIQAIKTFNKGRIKPILASKYETMSRDAFSFFRATDHLFYADFVKQNTIENSPLAWLCGDLHFENFGSYKGDNDLVYFDVNDFDEAALAPITWDILRFLTSIYVAVITLGAKRKTTREIAHKCLEKYVSTLQKGKAQVIENEIAEGTLKDFLDKVAERKRKELLNRYTTKVQGKRKFLLDEKRLMKVSIEKKEAIYSLFDTDFKVLDVAFRLAGTSSLGLERYAILVKDKKGKKRLLDLKMAKSSALLPYLPQNQVKFKSEALRVVTLQRRFQQVSPAFLHEVTFENQSFILRELQPSSDRINMTTKSLKKQKEINKITETMMELAASGHLRGAGRQGSAIADELIEFAEKMNWQTQVLEYADAYAQQVEKDFELFRQAYAEKVFVEK